MKEIPIGTSCTTTGVVAEGDTAAVLGSGDLLVLGTPALAAWMENAAMRAIAPFLAFGSESSVGTALQMTHERASRIGAQIRATATVTAVDGRRIDFTVSAVDDTGATVGRGTHTRFVVEIEKFMARIEK